jgi:hypothetical protein
LEQVIQLYEVRPRKDHRGVDLISDVLPFARLWYDGPNAVTNAIGYAEHYSRSHDAVIRVYNAEFVTSRVLNRNVKLAILSVPALHASASCLAPPLLSVVCL